MGDRATRQRPFALAACFAFSFLASGLSNPRRQLGSVLFAHCSLNNNNYNASWTVATRKNNREKTTVLRLVGRRSHFVASVHPPRYPRRMACVVSFLRSMITGWLCHDGLQNFRMFWHTTPWIRRKGVGLVLTPATCTGLRCSRPRAHAAATGLRRSTRTPPRGATPKGP